MSKLLKRFLSLTMAVIMVIGMIPANAVYATEAENEAKTVATVEELTTALTEAQAGDVVKITASEIEFGENAASIVIDKAITIQGAGVDATKLVFNSATSAFVIQSSNVTIQNLTIQQGTKEESFGISIDKGAWDAPAIQYSDITIKNVAFDGGDYAMCVIGEDVVIDGCTFTDQDSHNIIVYSLKGDSKIINNTFNASKGNNKAAILWEGGVSTTLTGDALAAFMGGGKLTIDGNTANGKGVFFQFTNWKLVEGMEVAITGNKIDAFTNKAIALYDNDGATASNGNEFASVTISQNVFTNVPAGRPVLKEYTGTVTVNASGNYLGSAEPDCAALLVGDKVTVESYYADEALTQLVSLNADPVAQVGNETYATLQAAIDAAVAANGGMVTLLADVTLTETVTVSQPTSVQVYLNLNGNSITSSASPVIKNDGFMMLAGEGKLVSTSNGTVLENTQMLTIFQVDVDAGTGYAIMSTGSLMTVNNGTFRGNISIENHTAGSYGNPIKGGTFTVDVTELCGDDYFCKNNGDGTYSVVEKVELPTVEITDITESLTDEDPELTFALNFKIKDAENLTEEYLEKLFEAYGDYYVDYVLTIEGLTDAKVTFNASGGADGYLAGQYDAWSKNWLSVPFEDVDVNNGQSLYIMEYAASLMGSSGLRFTLAEVAEIVQNFDCGVYFTPEFLAANPNMKVSLELKVFTEDAKGNKIQDISVATNVFRAEDAAEKVASVTDAQGKVTKYATVQAAIDAAQNGDTVTLLADCDEDVTVVQAPDKAITIDGNGMTMTGSITVNGKTAAYATAGLTIKNVKFEQDTAEQVFVSLGVSGNNNTRYTSNVTVENCTFTGTDNTAVGVKNYTGGCKNLTVTGCTATGMHSLVQVKGVAGVTVEDVTVNGKNGISVGTSTGVVIDNANITATGYGVRADGSGAYDATITNSTISAQDPIVVRKTTADGYQLTVDNCQLTGSNEKGYGITFTAGDDGTYTEPTGSFEASITQTEAKVYPTSEYVAKIGEKSYMSLTEAFKAAKSGDTITLLTDVTISEKWDARYTGAKFTVPVTIDGNGKTITFTGEINDAGNHSAAFRFEADAVVKNLTIDMSAVPTARMRAISAKGDLTVEGCTFIGNGAANNNRAIIFGESAGAAIGEVDVTVTGSTFTNWRRGLGDNENAQNAKSVTATGNTFTNAGVNVSAAETVVFTDNKIDGGAVTITSYNDLIDNATVTGNELLNGAVGKAGNAVSYDNIQPDFIIVAPITVTIGETVKYCNTLAEAVSAAPINGAAATITVLEDLQIDATAKIVAGQKITLDLNGKTVDGTEKVRIALASYGDLILKDSSAEQTGIIKAGIGTAGNTVNICAGSFAMESGSIYSKNNAILIDEQAATVTISGGKITAEPTTDNSAAMYVPSTSDTEINISGGELVGFNGILLWNNTTINMTGGSIEAKGDLGIQGNGANDNTEINISGGSISGTVAAIYHPQGGKLNISGDAALSGGTGIVVKGGTVNISGGTITANGDAQEYTPVSSGFQETGDALYVEHYDNSANSGNYGTPVVTVTGGTFISKNGNAVASYANPNNDVQALTGFITGGIYSDTSAYSYLAPGYEPNPYYDAATGKMVYGVKAKTVAVVGITHYATLEEAVAAAAPGQSIYLESDVVLTDTLVIPADKVVTLELNGYTISQSKECTAAYSMIENLGNLTINGEGKISFTDTGAGDPNFGWGSYTITNKGTLVVNGGAIEHLGEQNAPGAIKHMICAIQQFSGSTVITGGTISTPNYRSVRINGGSLTVKGGEFIGQIWLQPTRGDAQLTITGGTFAPMGGDASAVFMENDGKNHTVSAAEISGGTFNGKIGASNAAALAGTVTGGSFTETAAKNTNQTLLKEGYILDQLADGTYGLVKGLRGAGTEDDPYKINNLDELILFRDSVNSGATKYNAPGVVVALDADIDMAGTDWSVNIGDDCAVTFDGIFDGKNHTISNLTATETAQKGDGYICTGLFGAIYGNAVVKNLTIANAKIDTGDFTGNNAAAVVGFAYNATGSVENVKVVNSSINAKNVDGTGVIVGYAYGGALKVTGCSVENTTVIGQAYVGGVVGYAGGKMVITNSKVTGTDVVANACAAGGIAGIMLAGGEVNTATVQNVKLTSTHENWQNAAGIAVGCITPESITVSNVASENVNVTAMVGAVHADKPTTPVAKVAARIGSEYYTTFAAALAAAQAGDKIDLLADVEASEVILIDKSLTINGNGHEVTSSAKRVFRVTASNTEVTLNDVKMVSTAVRVGTDDIRGISVDASLENVKLTLNNCSVDFTDASACDWTYAVNISGSGTGHTLSVNGGTYEGANVINVHGAKNTVTVKDATLNCLYPNNDMYAGSCIWVLQNQESTVEATGNTFNGSNAVAFNLGTGNTLTESNNTDNTKFVVAKIGDTYYTDLREALVACKKNEIVVLLRSVDLTGIEWEPVEFKGSFDGQNHTIFNLVVNKPGVSDVGFFSKTTGAEIKNVTFENAKVTGRLNVGVVAGTPGTTEYTNIKVTGHVEVNGMSYVGGVGGKNAYGNWTDITVDVDNTSYVKATSTENGTAYRTYVGGVVGFNGEGSHTFKNISSNIKVIGDVCDIGGLFGIAHYSNKFENVTFTGSVEAPEGAEEVGGIAGVWHNQKGYTVSFDNVTSTGSVTVGTETTTGSVVGGAYNPDNETAENSGSLKIDGKEVWICVAKIGEARYATIEEAIAAAQDNDTVKLLADVTINELIKIEKAITLDLGCNKVTATSMKAFEVYANATIQNGTIEAANRCVDTRTNVELNLVDLNLVATSLTYGNTQPLTIGGSDNGTKVIMSNVNIDAGNSGYGIITFVKTDLTATASTISGYSALYVKPGSDGSEFSFVNSTLSGSTAGNDAEGNSFSTIAIRANTVVVNVDAQSAVKASGNYCYAISLSSKVAGEENTDNVKVTVAGTIEGNILAGLSGNTVEVKAEYEDALAAAGYAVKASETEGMIVVTGKAVAQIGEKLYASIQAAIDAAQAGNTVVILENVELTETLTIPADKTVTLDLNGKTVSMKTADDAVYALILNKGDLTVIDSGDSGKLSYHYTGTNSGDAFNTIETAPGSVLTVKDGTIENLSADCLIAYAVDGLTNGGNGDVIVNIEGGIITSKKIAVRIFANSTTNTGYLNISGGEISGRVIIQNANEKANKAALNITGGTFTTNGYKADVLYVGNIAGGDIKASVSGGTFNGEIKGNIEEGFISGGTFYHDSVYDHVAEGYEVVPGYDLENHCAVFTVQAIPEQVVAYVGSVGYTDLQAAIDAAEASGATVYLAADVTVEQTLVVDGKVTIDLSGYTISGVPAEVAAYSVIENKGELTINDAVGGGAIVCDHKLAGSTGYAVNTITNTGKLTINGGVIENKSTASNQIGYAIDNNSTSANAIIVIKGGEVKASGSGYYDGIRQFCNSLTNENSVTVNGGTVSSIWLQNTSDDTDTDVQNTKDVKGAVVITDGTVNALYLEPSSAFEASVSGGTIGTISKFQTAEGRDLSGFISGGTFANDPSEFVAEGYCAKANDDGTYTVSGHTAGEAVKENEVAADCENPGSYDSVVYCSVCDEKLSSQTIPVDALGHTEEEIPGKDATCTETGLTAGVKCSVCGETLTEQTEISSLGHTEGEPETVEEDGKSYLVTKCEVCETELSREEVQTGPEVDENLTFKTSLGFASYIGVQFIVDKDAASKYEQVYVIVEQETPTTVKESKLEENIGASVSQYVYELHTVAKEMGDNLTVTVYGIGADGKHYKGETKALSVKSLAYDKLDEYYGKNNLKACKLLVDMLYYGDEAQRTFSYNADKPLTAELDEKYVSLASQDTTISVADTIAGDGDIKPDKITLGIASYIQIQMVFKRDMSEYDLYVTVGNDTTVIAGEDLEIAGGASVLILNIAAKNVRETHTIVVKDKNGNAVSPTYTLTVEGGAKSFLDKGQYQDLLHAMMKYGDSAADYFKK